MMRSVWPDIEKAQCCAFCWVLLRSIILSMGLLLGLDSSRAQTTPDWNMPDPGELSHPGACHRYYAGKGNEARFVCYDLIYRGAKGPKLVVIPANDDAEGIQELRKIFAITKYEITWEDFNIYCKSTSRCRRAPRSHRHLPVTGIHIEDAKNYARWLSKSASREMKTIVEYRLPTESEWEWAALAMDGGKVSGHPNCKIHPGYIISDHYPPHEATNSWGVVNAIGNAQEWIVKPSSALAVRGGSYEDNLKECDIALERPHDGEPDPTTGFRLVRDMK